MNRLGQEIRRVYAHISHGLPIADGAMLPA